MSKTLWADHYRPKTLGEYVFRDNAQKDTIRAWVKQGFIPHLLLSGVQGSGKTTLAKVLFEELKVNEFDILEINASRDNGVEFIRDKISSFICMMPFGPYKIVLLDEADGLSHAAQAVLRGLMEEYYETARFVLTCNYPHKIIPAIHSRCQSFHIEKTDQIEFTVRVATILALENVDFDEDTLDTFVKIYYPDLRKCINSVQQCSTTGKLVAPTKGDNGVPDYKIDMVNLFKEGKIREARQLLCSKARPEEINDIFRWLYDNLQFFGSDEETKDSAILIIKQGLVDHAICADAEINLSACLIKLARLQSVN